MVDEAFALINASVDWVSFGAGMVAFLLMQIAWVVLWVWRWICKILVIRVGFAAAIISVILTMFCILLYAVIATARYYRG